VAFIPGVLLLQLQLGCKRGVCRRHLEDSCIQPHLTSYSVLTLFTTLTCFPA